MVKVSKLEKLVEFVCQSCHMERSNPSRSKIILTTSIFYTLVNSLNHYTILCKLVSGLFWISIEC